MESYKLMKNIFLILLTLFLGCNDNGQTNDDPPDTTCEIDELIGTWSSGRAFSGCTEDEYQNTEGWDDGNDGYLILYSDYSYLGIDGDMGDDGDMGSWEVDSCRIRINDAVGSTGDWLDFYISDDSLYISMSHEGACQTQVLSSLNNPNNGAVSGYVTDSDGNPINNASIILSYDVPTISNMEVNYSIPNESNVSIDVLDLCGNLVKPLIENEIIAAGTHTISWDGMDQDGHRVVDGVYSIHLQGDDQSVYAHNILANNDYSDIENNNYHILTDENGYFSIPYSCLSFGQIYTNDGNNGISVPSKVKVWVVAEGEEIFSTEGYSDIDFPFGILLNIDLP